MNKKYSLVLLFLSLSAIAHSQIVDDSTKLVYGPTTSVYTYEKYVQEIDSIFFPIDTLIKDLEKFEFVQKSKISYQNLGVNGSALKPVYYQLPQTIGKTAGYEAFTPYFKTAENFKYYNSRSPFMDLNVAFGGKNRTNIDFSFSRNVNPNLNVGFDIHRINSDKQIGAQTKIGDNNVQSSTVDIYTYYASENKKYTLLFHSLKFTHKVKETGGIVVDDFTDERLQYLYLDADIQLRTALAEDVRVRHHLFHQYSVKPFFQVYHVFDKIKQENYYSDPSIDTANIHYNNHFISVDTTNEASKFSEIRNQIGIKGKFSSKFFYNIYLKRRDIDFVNNKTGNADHTSENYIGAKLKYIHNENNDIETSFELLPTGEYFLKGQLNNKYFKAAYTSSIYKPSFLVDLFFSNQYIWVNRFNSTFVNTIEGSMNLELGGFIFKPKVAISTINDYIYFDKDKLPAQADLALINKYSMAVDWALNNNLHFEHELIFNGISGDGKDAFRIPKWALNGKWYYDGIAFNDYMPFQIGINLHWQSSYFAKAYNPVTQQFYIQDDFKVKSYFVADIFFVFKAKKARIFAKITHVNQPTEGGYMATPFYPGQQRIIGDLGIRWLFFD